VPISLSTLADQVGGCRAALMPLFKRLEAYVLSAERLHGTTLRFRSGKGKTDTGRILGLCARRQAVWRSGAARGGVLLLTRSGGEHPQAHLATIPVSSRPTPTAAMASSTSPAARLADPGSGLLGSRPASVLRDG